MSKQDKKWTKERIRELIETNDKMLEHSLIVLFRRQTPDERVCERTSNTNKMGFNQYDAEILTSFAKQILNPQTQEKYPEGRRLSPKQKTIARKKLKKYARQLADYANAQKELKIQKALGVKNTKAELHQKGGDFGA